MTTDNNKYRVLTMLLEDEELVKTHSSDDIEAAIQAFINAVSVRAVAERGATQIGERLDLNIYPSEHAGTKLLHAFILDDDGERIEPPAALLIGVSIEDWMDHAPEDVRGELRGTN